MIGNWVPLTRRFCRSKVESLVGSFWGENIWCFRCMYFPSHMKVDFTTLSYESRLHTCDVHPHVRGRIHTPKTPYTTSNMYLPSHMRVDFILVKSMWSPLSYEREDTYTKNTIYHFYFVVLYSIFFGSHFIGNFLCPPSIGINYKALNFFNWEKNKNGLWSLHMLHESVPMLGSQTS